jgi:hypothetical protein
VAELYYRSINGGSRKSPPAPSSWWFLKKKVKLFAFAELFLNVPPANKWNQLIKTSQLVVRWLLFYETKVILILYKC